VAMPRFVDTSIARVRAHIAAGKPQGCTAASVGDVLLSLSPQAAGAVMSLGSGGISGQSAHAGSPADLPSSWSRSVPIPPPPVGFDQSECKQDSEEGRDAKPAAKMVESDAMHVSGDDRVKHLAAEAEERARITLGGCGDGHWHWLTYG